ncbi:MAG: alpha/beta hydrolase-fold protein [Syntrophomonadaceae bacterium]
MKSAFSFFLIAFLLSSLLRAQWKDLTTGVNVSLFTISSVNDSVCWAAGDNGTVIKTTDGGQTWQRADNAKILNASIYNIFALDAETALCTSTLKDITMVFRTTDGGINWSQVFLQRGGFIDAIWLTTPSTGFMLGDPVGGRWSFWKTNDGGATWDSSGMFLRQIGSEAGWNNCLAVNGNKFFFGTNSSRFYYSTNSGNSWTSVQIPMTKSVSVAFNNSKTGMAAGDTANYLKTTDNGLSWKSYYPGIGNITFVAGSDSQWFASGYGNIIYGSSDGGSSWIKVHQSAAGSFNGITKSRTGKYFWLVKADGGITKGANIVKPFLAPKFQAFLNRANNSTLESRYAIIDSFMAANPNMPYVEQDSFCCFIFRGNAGSVNVAGDMNNWSTFVSMYRIPGTDFWYSPEKFPPDARIEYKFIVDGQWITDTLNPRKLAQYKNSELRMPQYVQPLEFLFYKDIPHGIFHDTVFSSPTLGNTRKISVYTPPDYNLQPSDSFPVVLFHDGQDFIQYGYVQNSLDYMIANKIIPPLIAVFVPPVNRDPEYIGDYRMQYSKFIAAELMPYIDKRYRTQLKPERRVNLGISSGGNIALWLAYNYPGVFGNAASLSGNILPETFGLFQYVSSRALKLYIDAGRFDLSGLLDLSENFKSLLTSKGYKNQFNIWNEGHSWLNWAAHLDNALGYFFLNAVADVHQSEDVPDKASLMQNYPNPFNPSTTIRFSIPSAEHVILKIYDVLGKEVATLMDENKPGGNYKIEFNGSNLSSGIYFFTLHAGKFMQTKKLILMK